MSPRSLKAASPDARKRRAATGPDVLRLRRRVTIGNVQVPFRSTCAVNGKPFGGTITVEWTNVARVPEYDTLARACTRICAAPTTCEQIAIETRELLAKDFPENVSVTVTVTSKGHYPASARVE